MNEENKFGLNPKAIDLIYRVLRGFPEVEEVILFGSRAEGTYRQGSDIDLALKGKTIESSMVRVIKNLLQDGLPLPYFFDVLNYNTLSNEKLKSHIDMYGVVFYKNN